MAKLEGTQTAENLIKSFAGESQARNRYTYFAYVADQENYKQIKNFFLETAENEKEHAKRLYKLLVEGFEGSLPKTITINNADYPIDMGNTLRNLEFAAAGEREEHSEIYPAFAETAEKEGFKDIAAALRSIAKAEVNHESRFLKLADNIKNDEVFKRSSTVKWICSNCGLVYEGKSALEICPACLYPKSYFELYVENF